MTALIIINKKGKGNVPLFGMERGNGEKIMSLTLDNQCGSYLQGWC